MESDMSNETVRVLNTQTGKVGTVPRRIFEHPVLSGGSLVEVEHDQKPYVSELYRPRTVEEWESEHVAVEAVEYEPVISDSEDWNETESEDAE